MPGSYALRAHAARAEAGTGSIGGAEVERCTEHGDVGLPVGQLTDFGHQWSLAEREHAAEHVAQVELLAIAGRDVAVEVWSRRPRYRLGHSPGQSSRSSRSDSAGTSMPKRSMPSTMRRFSVSSTAIRANRFCSAGMTSHGRERVTRAAEHLFGGAVVLAVAATIAPVLVGELPPLQRVVGAGDEAIVLLLVADVQPELHHDHTLGDERAFEVDDRPGSRGSTRPGWRIPRCVRRALGRTSCDRTPPCRPGRAPLSRTATGSGDPSLRGWVPRSSAPCSGRGSRWPTIALIAPPLPAASGPSNTHQQTGPTIAACPSAHRGAVAAAAGDAVRPRAASCTARDRVADPCRACRGWSSAPSSRT